MCAVVFLFVVYTRRGQVPFSTVSSPTTRSSSMGGVGSLWPAYNWCVNPPTVRRSLVVHASPFFSLFANASLPQCVLECALFIAITLSYTLLACMIKELVSGEIGALLVHKPHLKCVLLFFCLCTHAGDKSPSPQCVPLQHPRHQGGGWGQNGSHWVTYVCTIL